ncbi:MAG TPA: zincin-like metallopeptidase domain-containing protein [Bacteroidia bacterium]|nr:zincin-like metallopeptidase domain-containing protein [Bacteroidia bacterium]HRH08749.1 zincin-like metallopeptidase domain-containing protein [Bacteroidia bacterium]
MTNTQQNQPNTTKDIYQIVTNHIIEKLEKKIVPWQQPWTDSGLPRNLVSKKPYKGINVWLLNSLNYSQNYFLTFNQIKELGGSVKKGEKSQLVVFWKWLEKEDEKTKEVKKTPLLKYYTVFNIDQCTGIPKEKLPVKEERQNNPIEACEKVINEMPKKPIIQHNEQRAFYHTGEDYVNMPKLDSFVSIERYYGTLFHELVHATGHSERLNRKELLEQKGPQTRDYAIEELTAEMGASYLKSYTGIPHQNFEDNIAYIQHWLEKLKKDKKFIVHASGQAQKAVDYILNERTIEKEIKNVFVTSIPKVEEITKKKDELTKTRTRNVKTKESLVR